MDATAVLHRWSPRRMRWLCLSSFFFLTSLTVSQAQISLDGSLGPASFLFGPNYVIPDQVGQIRGANLFHSFGFFNVLTGETATFTGPSTINNIIGRVTGGFPSLIDGQLRSAIPGANFFLINPSGVLFGPNASLDVSGSFHVSTADFLRFEDGAVFSAHLGDASVLSVAAPASFGFLGANPADITILGSTLEVPQGQTLSVTGGEISLFGGTLRAPSGQVRLTSVASATEVSPHSDANVMAPGGNVTLSPGSRLDASGDGGGTIRIRGGRIVVDQSLILANTEGETDGATVGIDLYGTEAISITNGSAVTTDVLGAGKAGDLVLRAGQVTVSNTSLVSSRVFSGTSGDGGDIDIKAASLDVMEDALISTATAGDGRGGDLRAEVDRLQLTGAGGITSLSIGPGQGGDITVRATESISITGRDVSGFQSSLTTAAMDSGNAGSITLSAPMLQVDDSFIATDAQGVGRGGSVTLDVGTLTLAGGARISSSASHTGAGGAVTITALESVTITGHDALDSPSGVFSLASGSGNAGRLVIKAPTVEVEGGEIGVSSVQLRSLGTGRGGDVELDVGRLTLTDGAHVDSVTLGTGAGGSITITASEAVTVEGRNSHGLPSVIASFTQSDNDSGRLVLSAPTVTLMDGGLIVSETTARGRAGDIQVETGELAVIGGAQIRNGTAGFGPGGNVTVRATDSISLTGRGNDGLPSAAISMTSGSRDAGSMTVSARTIRLTQGALLETRTTGDGRAGDMMIEAKNLTLTDGGIIRSNSGAVDAMGNVLPINGAVGNITISATEAMTFSGPSGISATTAGGPGGRVTLTTSHLSLDGASIAAQTLGQSDGGDIVVAVEQLTLTGGAQIDNSTFGSGQGGTLTVHAMESVSLSGRNHAGLPSRISSSATSSGDAGRLSISAPRVDMNGGIIQSSTTGDGRAGAITMEVGRLTLSARAAIATPSGLIAPDGTLLSGTGTSGNISVTATDAIALSDESIISASTAGGGTAGGVFISTPTLELDGGFITAGTVGDARAGNIAVEVDTLTLSGGAVIDSGSGVVTDATGGLLVLAGVGTAGNITVSATDSASLSTSGRISSSTVGSGDAGTVSVSTPRLRIDGGSIKATTRGIGKAGDILLEVNNLTLTGGGRLDSSTSGVGKGGSVMLTATETVSVVDRGEIFSGSTGSGNAGTIAIAVPDLVMDGEGIIEARTTGEGNAGEVRVDVERLTLTGGAQIGSTSGITNVDGTMPVVGSGRAGRVTATATEVIVISGGDSTGALRSGLFSQTVGPEDTGGQIIVSTPKLTMHEGARLSADTGGNSQGGDIRIKVETLTLTDGAQIGSGSGIKVGDTLFVGDGQGGTVGVTATGLAEMTGPDSGLVTNTAGAGNGGDIRLQAQQLQLREGAVISAKSTASGNAGNIRLTVGDTFVSEASHITTEAVQAAGGNINVQAQTMVRLRHNSQITATVQGGPETIGGDITIDPEFVILENSRIVARATAGQGGNIRIQAGVFLADPDSVVDASSERGIDGEVDIRAPVADLSGSVVPLSQNFAQIAALLQQRCAERLHGGQVSSFVVGGRDGIPPEPAGGLPSPMVATVTHIAEQARSFHASLPAPHGALHQDHHGNPQIRGWPRLSFVQLAVQADCSQWRDNAIRSYLRYVPEKSPGTPMQHQ